MKTKQECVPTYVIKGNSQILVSMCYVQQGCTNPGSRVTLTNKFYTVAPDIYGSSVWNLLRVTVLAPIILMWLLNIRKTCTHCERG